MKEEKDLIKSYKESRDRSWNVLQPCGPACHRQCSWAQSYDIHDSIIQKSDSAKKDCDIRKDIKKFAGLAALFETVVDQSDRDVHVVTASDSTCKEREERDKKTRNFLRPCYS